jgi:glycosyltransferase involved in cell wall biosynthesis
MPDVSFTTAAENMKKMVDGYHDIQGYGHASYEIINSFEKFGIYSAINNSECPIGISMGFPTDYKFYPNQYKIGYTAWESTELKPEWRERMLQVDELWATSSWTANVFKETTGREDIFIYKHGITMDWSPKKRQVNKIFRFLHIGEPQLRKNGQMVVDSFIKLFGNNPEFQLILKVSSINTTRVFGEDGSVIGSPDSKYSNIIIIDDYLDHNQMIELYHKCNALVYPTMGEGFGFIPLQSLATGMPCISTYEWADYKKYITNPLDSKLQDSEYPMLHPGKVYNVDINNLRDSMSDLVNNYDIYSKISYKNSFKIHMEYDWHNVTENTSKRIKKILKSCAS